MPLISACRRALVLTGLVAYTLLFGEIFVRIADPQVLLPRYVTGTPWGVRGNIPGAQYRHITPEVDVGFRINSQGMRADRDFPPAKPPGGCRVALFGDSYFMGYELNLPDTFASRLEARLRKDGYNAEILNFSVSGFGTAEMIRIYENFGRRFAPDVVIFQWHSTDLDDNVRSGLYELKGGRLESTGRSYLPAIRIQDALMKFGIYRLIADNSHLYSLARERLSKMVQKMLVIRERLTRPDANRATGTRAGENRNGLAAVPYPVQLSAALLQHAQQLTRDESRDFFVVDIPDRITRTSFKSSIGGIPELVPGLNVIQPLAALVDRATPDTKLYFERGHFHLTPVAIDVLVNVAAPRLEQSANLRGCRTNR